MTVYIHDIPAFVTFDGPHLRAMVRATDKATFDAQAFEVGLKVHKNPAQPAVIDPETDEVIREAVPASGPLIPAKGVTIAELGPRIITPGTYDDEGNEITPPVIDPRFHANFWLHEARGNWESWALMWSAYGEPGDSNKNESSLLLRGVELVDPDTINTPDNRLSGY
jgi:hypothetical protein